MVGSPEAVLSEGLGSWSNVHLLLTLGFGTDGTRNKGVVIGGGERQAVLGGEPRLSVVGGGVRQAVVGGGVPGGD